MAATMRVLIVGGGFAGFHCARRLQRLPQGTAEVTLVSPTDYLLYTPLLPGVAAGAVPPTSVAVPYAQTLRTTRTVLGSVLGADLDRQTVSVRLVDDSTRELPWDRLVLCPGSVTRQMDVPGLAEHGHGLKNLAEALYLHDHVLRQLELAQVSLDRRDRQARCTVVVVGAGYAGTELTARLQHALTQARSSSPTLAGEQLRFVLCEAGSTVMPELGPALAARATGALRRRGIEIRTGTRVTEIRSDGVTLSDGTGVDTRTVVWTAGVTPGPLVAALAHRHALAVSKGRLVVDSSLRVPGYDGVWCLGDAAAAPDLTRPGSVVPPTAQHAQRQGAAVARNVAASVGVGRPRPYRHRDLGLVADLGGRDAVARPLGVSLSGLAAKAVTRGYHLVALPHGGNRARVATDWALDAVTAPVLASLGLVPAPSASLAAEGHPEPDPSFAEVSAVR